MTPADLRVPLSALPGLDPVGLFVLDEGGEVGRYLATYADAVHVMLDGRSNDMGGLVLVDDIDLDLADASTRDRVARYIAERVGLEVGSTAPGWSRPTGRGRRWTLAVRNERHHESLSEPVMTEHCTVPGAEYPPSAWRVLVDGAGLDPDDDTRLPDGSRLVDAVALARVAVHVGGAR